MRNSPVEMSIHASACRSAPSLAGDPDERRQIIVAVLIEQPVFSDRAGCDEADHRAPHHRFRSAPPRLGRIFGLLANRDAVSLRYEFLQIVVGGMNRHPAHRDVIAEMFAALCQRDAKRARGDDSVVEEQLVEIAHPVEEQAIRIGRPDLDVLLHHRRDAGGRRVRCRLFTRGSILWLAVVHRRTLAEAGARPPHGVAPLRDLRRLPWREAGVVLARDGPAVRPPANSMTCGATSGAPSSQTIESIRLQCGRDLEAMPWTRKLFLSAGA